MTATKGLLGWSRPRLRLRIAFPCPRCRAEAGQVCRRWSGGRIRGEESGGGYWKPLASFHRERKCAATGAGGIRPRGPVPVAAGSELQPQVSEVSS